MARSKNFSLKFALWNMRISHISQHQTKCISGKIISSLITARLLYVFSIVIPRLLILDIQNALMGNPNF